MTQPRWTVDGARWHVHGTDPRHLVLYRSIEEGPLAEIACHGDVDPVQVAAALNDAPVPDTGAEP